LKNHNRIKGEYMSNSPTFVEKRKLPRILFESFGELEFSGSKEECYLVNLSHGGTMAFVVSSLKTYDKIKISFSAGNKKFSRTAIVRDSKEISESRKNILKIGKKLNFQFSVNIAFDELLEPNEFEYININH
jgi:DNA polymerase III alpha subunit (gram-positive type)